jgi:hypothetical protein
MVSATGAWAFGASTETPKYEVWLRWAVVGAAVAALALLASTRRRGWRHGAAKSSGAEIRSFLRGPDKGLLNFLAVHRGSARYAAAVTGSMGAASYLSAGIPVLPMGGFTGDAPVPTTKSLASLVSAGSVRYVVLGGQHPDTGRTALSRDGWITSHCRALAVEKSVYDCRTS